MRRHGFAIAQLLRVTAGLLVWSSAFVFLYAGSYLGCRALAPDPQTGLLNAVTGLLLIFTLLHLGALGVLAARWWRGLRAADGEAPDSVRFRRAIEGLVLITAGAGVLMIALPLLMVPPCPL